MLAANPLTCTWTLRCVGGVPSDIWAILLIVNFTLTLEFLDDVILSTLASYTLLVAFSLVTSTCTRLITSPPHQLSKSVHDGFK